MLLPKYNNVFNYLFFNPKQFLANSVFLTYISIYNFVIKTNSRFKILQKYF